MDRAILAFHRDPESHWVAELSCGHNRHVRHDPPFVERPWVTSAKGRASRRGTLLDCVRCERGEIPDGYQARGRSAVFTEETVPDALLKTHATKRGVWGRIHVTRGELAYHVHPPFERHVVLTPSTPGVVVPEVEHHVECVAPVEFFVEFWRRGSGG